MFPTFMFLSFGVNHLRAADGMSSWTGADQEGCILIPRYLEPEEQLDLLKSALSEYTLPPNPLSLSTHYSLTPNLFQTYTTAPQTIVPSIFSSLPLDEQAAIKEREVQGHDTRKSNDTLPGGVVGYDNILKSGKEWEGDKPGSRLGSKTVGELMKELRWANLGWVYRVSLFFTSQNICMAGLTREVDDKVL
jgi:alkylated DNA repair protein alkB family protein 1